MITWYPNYLYSFDIPSIDNVLLFDEILKTETYLKQWIADDKLSPDNKHYGSFSTKNYALYNLFTFPGVSISNLYKKIIKYGTPLLNPNYHYWIGCWFNVFRKNEKIDWHGHWPPELEVWHGFYCVNSKDSYTEYKIPNCDKIIKVPSQDGRLVIGKSENDEHRSSLWNNPDKPRVTVAFDIIPLQTLLKNNFFQPNHFLPFK